MRTLVAIFLVSVFVQIANAQTTNNEAGKLTFPLKYDGVLKSDARTIHVGSTDCETIEATFKDDNLVWVFYGHLSPGFLKLKSIECGKVTYTIGRIITPHTAGQTEFIRIIKPDDAVWLP